MKMKSFVSQIIPLRHAGVLLLVNKHPGETPLSVGYDITQFPDDDQAFGAASTKISHG